MTEKVNLDDLYKTKKNTFDHKIKIYDKILNRIHKKIKTTARNRNSECFCMYVIPEFILGIPKYDITLCTTHIIDKLEKNGFKIKYTHPNLLFISWKHYIPYYERQEYKKKTGINIDGFGNVITKKSKKNESGNINNLLLKNSEKSIKVKKTDFKDISSYKPTGKFIYDKETIKTIQTINL
tara:strand:+ start:2538 stop:3080 length:543 start_codon:yes stop_codon:yes gene_type:complete